MLKSPKLRGDLLIGYATIGVLSLIPGLATYYYVDLNTLSGKSPSFVRLAFSIAVLLCVFRPLQLVFQRHPEPLRQLRKDLVSRWTWVVTALFLLAVLPVTLEVSTYFKKLIPSIEPFYADPLLIRLDRAMFFGYDPWRITHAIFGPISTRMIDGIYAMWHFGQVGLIMLMIFTADRRFQLQAVLSYQLGWLVMGAGMAIVFSSVGPCFFDDFYGSNYFAPLMMKIEALDQLYTLDAMDYLLATKGTDAIGAGISAMPSLHVGIAVLTALCVRDRWKKWQWLAWTYAAIIFIGSIHLGWHYASDGMVSALGMVIIWLGAGAYLDWLGRWQQRRSSQKSAASAPSV